VVAAVHERQYANLDKAAAAAREYGVPGEILEPDEMRRRGLPKMFHRGYFEPHGGILHPGRYVRALRRLVTEGGTRLYEGTRVDRIEHGPSLVVHTARGRVRCRNVVIGTNAFSPSFDWLRSSVIRMYVQLFRTAPLTPSQMEAVGWRGREGIYTAHEMLESYRLTDDNRIVGGAKHVRYGFAGRPLPYRDAAVARSLADVFRQRFPELEDVQITDHWGGPIALSLDFLPVIERDRADRRVIYAVGYAGHGLALASYAGRMVTDLLLERDGPGAALWTRRRLRLPPEPLRWLVVRGLTGLFGWMDERADRQARPGGQP
jgi:glycine/D-amino acid oxidase-like deaminating enzyme